MQQLLTKTKLLQAILEYKYQRFERIDRHLSAKDNETVIDAKGKYLIPGMIDDQVHFREPGMTHKGTIASESRAAVAGGIISYMEMPNVDPATTTISALEKKFAIAEQTSLANYSFYLGATENNLEQIKQLNPAKHCGVKVFMGASTGSLLVENPSALEAIFCQSPALIVTHCESGVVIANNLEMLKKRGHTPTILEHPIIRDTEACYTSSSYAVSLAKKYHSQLHVLHITSAKELSLFEAGKIENKQITAEACVHHLWFSEEDYLTLGNQIKCNPSIKSRADREALIHALHTNKIDIIATDHAPHTWQEKQAVYSRAPAGLPLVEHALLSLFDHVHQKRLSLTQVVEKTAHNPAKRYAIDKRGFIREGYYADFVLVDMNETHYVSHENCRYLCGWTPFHQHRFSSSIQGTWVNGTKVYDGTKIIEQPALSKRLAFNR